MGTNMIPIEQIGFAMLSSAVYSIVFYAKELQSDPDTKFDKFKFAATIIVGVGVGALYGYVGIDVNPDQLFEQLTMYAGTVAIVETLLKTFWRKYKREFGKEPLIKTVK